MKTLTNKNLTIEERVTLIENLNLEPIMVKIMNTKEGEGWSLEQVIKVEKWYKRFLILNLKYPNKSIVPNHQIDTFWHYHILDTMKYDEDCKNSFGYFLHHFPYFGIRSEEDAKNLSLAFEETLNLINLEFKEDLNELKLILMQ